MKHFRKILSNINVEPLLKQVAANPQLWNYDDIWTRGKPQSVLYATDNIVLRYNRSPDWNKAAFTILSEACPIVFGVMYAVCGELLGRVIISKVKAGVQINPHIDHMPDGIAPVFQRFQVPLSVSPGVLFHCGDEKIPVIPGDTFHSGDEQVYMKPGEAWAFNNQVMHSVQNNSNEDRISMLIDITPFTPVVIPKGNN